MSTTMVGLGQDLHNIEKYMKYYTGKIHQVDKWVEVSNIYYLNYVDVKTVEL